MFDRLALSVLISPFNNIIILYMRVCTYIYLLYVGDGRRLERCYRHVFHTLWTQQIFKNRGKIIPLHELNRRQQVSYYYYYCIHAAAAVASNSQYYFFPHTYTLVLTGQVQLKWFGLSRTLKIFITNNVTI